MWRGAILVEIYQERSSVDIFDQQFQNQGYPVQFRPILLCKRQAFAYQNDQHSQNLTLPVGFDFFMTLVPMVLVLLHFLIELGSAVIRVERQSVEEQLIENNSHRKYIGLT